MKPGQRVRCPLGLTGEVVKVSVDQVFVYMGTYDGKRWDRWFLASELRPTIEQELEDLL
jgi:hypothetical protein